MEHFDTPNELKQRLSAVTTARFGKTPEACTDAELCQALLALTQQLAAARPAPAETPNGRKLYYFSAEFLMGKLLSNNLLALGFKLWVFKFCFHMALRYFKLFYVLIIVC